MSHSFQPGFGKRNLRKRLRARSIEPTVEERVPLFSGSCDEPGTTCDDRVQDSFLAVVKAGGVVGAFFMVLDATGNGNTFRSLFEILPGHPEALMTIPFLILLGLMSGGMAAATSVLITHPALKLARWTGPIVYGIGGAAAASGFSYVLYALLRTAPIHGFLLDCLAGGLGGFCYRYFAVTSYTTGSAR